MKVRDIMRTGFSLCVPSDTVLKAAEIMRSMRVRNVPVVSGATTPELLGMITAFDVVTQCLAAGHQPDKCPVENHLSQVVLCVHPDEEVGQLPRELPMEVRRGFLIPIVDEEGVVGVITEEIVSYHCEIPEPVDAPMAGRTAQLELIWRCLICGYVWHRKEPLLQKCPNCGAPKEEFVLVSED